MIDHSYYRRDFEGVLRKTLAALRDSNNYTAIRNMLDLSDTRSPTGEIIMEIFGYHKFVETFYSSELAVCEKETLIKIVSRHISMGNVGEFLELLGNDSLKLTALNCICDSHTTKSSNHAKCSSKIKKTIQKHLFAITGPHPASNADLMAGRNNKKNITDIFYFFVSTLKEMEMFVAEDCYLSSTLSPLSTITVTNGLMFRKSLRYGITITVDKNFFRKMSFEGLEECVELIVQKGEAFSKRGGVAIYDSLFAEFHQRLSTGEEERFQEIDKLSIKLYPHAKRRVRSLLGRYGKKLRKLATIRNL